MATPDSAAVVGARVRAVRYWQGWTQEYLAKLLKIPPAKVSQWETGGHRPTIAHLIRLKHETGVTTDFMYTGDLPSVARALSTDAANQLRSAYQQACRELDIEAH